MMLKNLILLSLLAFSQSAFAQDAVPTCGWLALRTDEAQLHVVQKSHPQTEVRAFSLASAAKELSTRDGLDVQSDEPKDGVTIARQANGHYALVIRDHMVTKTESTPVYDVRECNDAANAILNYVLNFAN